MSAQAGGLGGSQARDARIDALKGVAIACVVLFHVMGQFWITNPRAALIVRAFVSAFMLPLFAFLSGYVLSRPGGFHPRDYFVRRTLGLMVPYVVWELLYGAIFRHAAFASVGAFGHYALQVATDPHAEGRMWYLYVLWVCLILLGLARLRGDRTWMVLASLPVALAVSFVPHFGAVAGVYPFAVLGLLVRRAEPALTPWLLRIAIGCGVAFVPLWLALRWHGLTARIRTPLDIAFAPRYAPGVYTLALLTATAAVGALFAWSAWWRPVFVAPLAIPGRLSFGIYVTHFLFIDGWHEPAAWLFPVMWVVALAAGMALTLLLQQWRPSATLLLGERWRPRPSRPRHEEETL